jgi:hypothetical protein
MASNSEEGQGPQRAVVPMMMMIPKFEVFTLGYSQQVLLVCDHMVTCGLVERPKGYGGICCFHLLGRRVGVKMGAVDISDMMVVFYKTELHQITEDRNLELLNYPVEIFAFLNKLHVSMGSYRSRNWNEYRKSLIFSFYSGLYVKKRKRERM